MANIRCENTDCIFCSQDRSCLNNLDVWIGDIYYAGCSEFSSYGRDEDYQTEFWKAFSIKGQEGKCERRKAMGKLIMINGRKFFTEDNPNYDEDNMRVTDGVLGTVAGYISSVKNNWEQYIAKAEEFAKNNYKNVLELPIAAEGEQSK